jgi:hypothetical protein
VNKGLKMSYQHIQPTTKKVQFIKKSLNGEPNLQYLHCPAYDRLISLYAHVGKIDKAIQVCELGISRGDRTNFAGGFEKKIQSLKKSMEKAKVKNAAQAHNKP